MLLMVLLALSAPTATDPDEPERIVVDRVVAVVDRAVVLQSEVDVIVAQFEQAMPIPAGGCAWAMCRRISAAIRAAISFSRRLPHTTAVPSKSSLTATWRFPTA
jgi:hypothetical protein